MTLPTMNDVCLIKEIAALELYQAGHTAKIALAP